MARFRARPSVRLATLITLSLLPIAAAALERVGPNDPVHGFPRWYQDPTGVTLDLCVPRDEAEAALCVLPDVPPLGFPESFPNNWVVEHFYWSGEAIADNDTTDALLVLALESTFAADEVVAGDQIVFGRMRIRVGRKTAIPDGEYRVYTPYGVRDFTVANGAGEINQTWDIGFACAQGTFDCALQSDIDHFLLASDEPGGAELPPISTGGRQYIADPATTTFVTGSQFGTYTLANGQTRNANVFLVERISPSPAIVAETYQFTLAGRIFDGTIVADAKVDRASYARDANGNQVDVYANGHPALPSRRPAEPEVTVSYPTIAFYSMPCAGPEGGPYSAPAGVPVPLARNGSVYWANELNVVLPPAICVQKTLPGEASTFEAVDPLGDQIFVTKALYTPETRTLEVEASTSDLLESQLELGRFGSLDQNVLLDNGRATVVLAAGEAAPPATVRVFSNQNGQGEKQVTTRAPGQPAPATGVALTPYPASPQKAGTPVVFVAQGDGASTPYEYQFWSSTDGGVTWSIAQPYSSAAHYVLNGAGAGAYEVAVWVRTSPNVQFDATNITTYQFAAASQAPATGVSLTPESTTAAVAQVVELTATAAGSSGYEFQFFVSSDGGVNWTIAQPYSPDNTYSFSASEPGDYLVASWVRTSDAVSFDASDIASVRVPAPIAAPATDVTIAPDPNQPSPHVAGTGPVVFTAAASGGSGTYEYQFFVSADGGVTWSVAQIYSTSNSYSFAADQAGDFLVAVWARTKTTVNFDVANLVRYVVTAP